MLPVKNVKERDKNTQNVISLENVTHVNN